MKRNLGCLTLSIMGVILITCGCKKEPVEKMISPSKVEIIGLDAGSIAVSGDVKVYMFENGNNSWSIRALVPLTNKQQYPGLDEAFVSMQVCDVNRGDLYDGDFLCVSDRQLVGSLLSSPVGTQKELPFALLYENLHSSDYNSIAETINKIEYLTLSPSIPSQFSSGAEEVSSSGSNNWDEVLDQYEEMVNSFVSLAQKASAGNKKALSEYEDFLDKVEDLSEELEDADDEMTSAQVSRYMKILSKMTNAASKISEDALDDLDY